MPCFGCLRKKNSYNVTASEIGPVEGNYRASTLVESGQVSPASQTEKQFPEHNSASGSQRTTPEKVAIPPSPDRERTREPRNGHVIPETTPQSDDVAMTVTSTTITTKSIERGEFEETRTVTSAKVTEEDGTVHTERTVVTTDTNGNVPLDDGRKSPKSERRSSTSSSSSSDSEHVSRPEVIVTIQNQLEQPRSHVFPEENVTDEVESVTREEEVEAGIDEVDIVTDEMEEQATSFEANASFGAVEYNGTGDGEESVVKETVTVVTTTTSIDHDGDGIPDETVTHTTTTRTYSYEEEEEVTDAPCADEAMEDPAADVEPAAEFVPVYGEPVVEMEPSSEEVVTEDTPLYDEEQVAAEAEPAAEFSPVYDEHVSPASDEEPEVEEEIHEVSASVASSAVSSRSVSPEPDQSPPDQAVSDAPSDELADAHTGTWDATPNDQFSSGEATTTTVTTTTTYVVEHCDDEEEAEPGVETTETVTTVTMTSPDDTEGQENQMNEEEDEPREAERRSSMSSSSSSWSEHEEEKPVDE